MLAAGASALPRKLEASVLLGVDGGGSTTQAVVTDLGGHVIGRGLGPACNHRKVGFELATRALTTAIEGALGQVLGPRVGEGRAWSTVGIAAACFGLAGVDTSSDQELFTQW